MANLTGIEKIQNKTEIKNFKKATSNAAILFFSSLVCEIQIDSDGWDKSRHIRQPAVLRFVKPNCVVVLDVSRNFYSDDLQ